MNKKILMITLFCSAALTASAQRISASTDVVDCGQIIYNHPVKVDFELSNKDRGQLIIHSVKTSCGCTSVDYPHSGISGGKTFTVSVTYDARQMGHFDKFVGVYSNGSDQPLMLRMRGVVVDEVRHFTGDYPFSLGNLKADKNDIEFDDVNRGERPVQEVHIMNTTDGAVTPVVMHLPNYLSAEVSPSVIAPGHSGVARFTLDSRNLHDYGLTQTSVFLGMYAGDKVSDKKEISVSAVLLPGFEHWTDAQIANAPRLKLSEKEVDFGSFGGKKKKSATIMIENTGKSILDIRSLQMFTTGLNVSLNRSKLAPGETAKLKIIAVAKMLRAARSKPRVLMITNDPDNSKVVITVNIKD